MTDKLEMILADPDVSYVQLLAAYIRQSKWADRINVKWFTKQEVFLEEVGQSGSIPIVLVNRGWVTDLPAKGWIVLDETNAASAEHGMGPGAPPRLFKYQPIDSLLNAAMDIAQQAHSRLSGGVRSSPSGMTVVSFLSASGGAGKTTAAYQLVRLLGQQGKRSLLVNLEPICSLLTPDPEYSRQFGQYLYYSRSGSPKAKEWVKKLIRRHASAPIDILGGSGAFKEMEEITAEDIRQLLEHVKGVGLYRSAILDLDSGVSPSVKGALAASDQLVCMLTEDVSSIRKTAEFLNACPKWLETESGFIRSKLILAFNRWKGETSVDFRSLGVAVGAKLPYVPQWKLTPAWEQDQVEPLYERPLMQLAEALRLGMNGVSHASTA